MTDFPPGFGVTVGKQTFMAIGLRDHTRRDGGQTKLVEWETTCPDCGQRFRVMTTIVFTWPRRRCDACKAPGKRVRA